MQSDQNGQSTSKSSGRGRQRKAVTNGNDGSDSEEEYEVEYIIDMKGSGKKREFFVHWKGYPRSAETWEPEANLSCQDLIDEYLVN